MLSLRKKQQHHSPKKETMRCLFFFACCFFFSLGVLCSNLIRVDRALQQYSYWNSAADAAAGEEHVVFDQKHQNHDDAIENDETSSCAMSLVIPLIPSDFSTLLLSLKSHFVPGFRYPDELVLAVSSFDTNEHHQSTMMDHVIFLVERQWSDGNHPSTRVVVSATPNQQYAGENRNRGMRAASCTYVSFFDADDYASPGRLEALLYIFERQEQQEHYPQPLVGLYHRYTKDNNRAIVTNQSLLADSAWVQDDKDKRTVRIETFFRGLSATPGRKVRVIQFHKGWPTFRRDALLYNNVSWPDFERAQDFAFVDDLAEHFANRQIGLVWMILGHYLELGRNDKVVSEERGTILKTLQEVYEKANVTREEMRNVWEQAIVF